MNPASVRLAAAADARGIAEVHVLAWQQTYSGLVSTDARVGPSVDARERQWVQNLDIPDTRIVVAERDGVIVGWAGAADSRGPDAPRASELYGIYILADEYGTGTGQALLDAALGAEPAYLWVAAENPRAQAFYRRNGFVDDGTREEHSLGAESIVAARYVR